MSLFSSARQSVAKQTRIATVIAAAVAVTTVLSGCSLLEGPKPEVKRQEQQVPEKEPQFYPGGSAAENEEYFVWIMQQFATSETPVAGQPLVDHLVAAGFNKADMTVSFDKTRINFEADSIFVAVRVGEECLLGQVAKADRTFVATRADALGAEKNICIIGETRPIDW